MAEQDCGSMCGILGVLGHVDSNLFETALNRLSHRGPDGAGIWKCMSHQVVLGHRRLSIIDTTQAGSQPMHYGDHTIVYNGEIYNFLEIRQELEKKGHTFQTNSDTEVLLASFIEWKEKCLFKFNGMWSFAIWSENEKTLFLARDRFGKKPLFFSWQKDRFIFGSEMKAILPLMDTVQPSRHFGWICNHLFSYESTSRCLVEGVERFPAGSYAFIRPSDFKNRTLDPIKYWDTLAHLQEVPISYPDQVEMFRDLFIDACRLRMRSDVPIGTALSGGLDSSAVSCTMHHIGNHLDCTDLTENWQHAFVATFPGTDLDERPYAEAVVRHTHARGVFLPINPSEGIEKIEDYLYFFEELYLTSPIPMMDIYKEVSKSDVKVTLDGHGADELLSGYGGFLKSLNDSMGSYAYLKHILRSWGYTNPTWLDIFRNMTAIHQGKKGLFAFLINHLKNPIKDDIPNQRLGYFNQELFTLFHHTMLPTLLRNYDRYSMANGIEIRMPFLDHRLVCFCFSLPWQSKIPKNTPFTKGILRDAIGDLMPQKIRYRRSKIGFNTPFSDWIKGPWKEFLMDTMGSRRFLECNLIDRKTVRKTMENVIFGDFPPHEADKAWAGIMPFFWEQGFLARAGK